MSKYSIFAMVLFFSLSLNSYATQTPLVSGEDWATQRGKINSNDSDLDVRVTNNTAEIEKKADASSFSNVDNTSDADKPISTATQNALDDKISYGGNATVSTLSIDGEDGLNGIINVSDNTSKGSVGDRALIPIDGEWYKVEGGVAIKIGNADTGFAIPVGDGKSVVSPDTVYYVYVPVDITINGWTAISDVQGSIECEIWRSIYPTLPIDTDKISASSPIIISGSTSGKDSELTGWTTDILKGDVIAVKVNSSDAVTRVNITFGGTK